MKKKSKIEGPRIASVNSSSLRRAKSRKVRLERELIEPANPAFHGFSFSGFQLFPDPVHPSNSLFENSKLDRSSRREEAPLSRFLHAFVVGSQSLLTSAATFQTGSKSPPWRLGVLARVLGFQAV
jgi:hypothetical protein